MNEKFKNQIAIVTGGGSGIGRAVCLDLAKQGAKVMVLGRTEKNLNETKALIESEGGYAETYLTDVTNKKNVDSVISQIHKKHQQIDILICNAGNNTAPAFTTKMPEEDWDSVIKTHLYGTFYLVQASGEIMKEKKYGRIVLMSSIGGIFGLSGNANYGVAKTGLMGMMYTLSKEFAPFGITVNAIQPGIIETPMTGQSLQFAGEQIAKDTPIGRIGKPEDVSYAVTFFCAPEASFITGATLRVDGGYITSCGMDRLMMGFCMM